MNEYELSLISAAKKGKKKSLERLMDSYHKKVVELIGVCLGDKSKAEAIFPAVAGAVGANLKNLANDADFEYLLNAAVVNECKKFPEFNAGNAALIPVAPPVRSPAQPQGGAANVVGGPGGGVFQESVPGKSAAPAGVDLLTALKARRSVKNFRPDPVPQQIIDQIIEAGLYAPNGRGAQAASIIAVTDPSMRQYLAALNANFWGKDGDPFYGAPVILVVIADTSAPTYVYDGSLVIGNMLNAAYALGVGACWIHRAKQMFETNEGKTFLRAIGVPDGYEGIGNCVVGYPAAAPAPAAPRKPGRVYTVAAPLDLSAAVAGAPASQGTVAGAITVQSGSMKGATIPVADGETISLGKDPNTVNFIFPPDYKNVSRMHLEVTFNAAANKYTVVDHSTNGTLLIGGQRLVKDQPTAIDRNTVLLLANDECTVLLV